MFSGIWGGRLGIGTRLVEECLSFARSAGYARMTLWTNDGLTTARRFFPRTGSQRVRTEKHHSFGRVLAGQTWEHSI